MSTAPAPFTPAECDLRGMPYMPLDVVRLFDSDFYALSSGDEFKAGLSLWGKAFLQVPAGSLPDDDRILAHLSGAGPKWCKVKEMALRGWIKCEDGRLYHATVAEKVAEAWQARVDRRARTEAARAAKIAAKHATNGSQPPPSVTVSVTEPVAMSVTDNVTTLVAQSVTGSKGSTREGKGREEKKERAEGGGTMPPARSRARPPTPIPLDWQPSVELVEFGARLGMTEATVQRAADRMVDWAKGSGNRKVDWDATLRNWLRKDAEEPAFKSGALQLIREEGMPSVEVDNPVGTFLAGYSHGPH